MNNLREIKKIELVEKELNRDWDKIFPYMFRNCVNEFVKVLESHFNKDDLVNMYNNILTLKISFIEVKSLRTLWWLLTGSGGYSIEKNEILLNKMFFEKTMDRELLHMSICGKYKDIYYDGFSQFYYWGVKPLEYLFSAGDGINDGYTRVLEKRYFTSDYDISINEILMSNLEKIFGEEIIAKRYFKGDLYGLVLLLQLFMSDDDIKAFINDTDYIEEHDLLKLGIIKEVRRSFNFLITVYAKYEFALYKAGYITRDECHNNIVSYIKNFEYDINYYLRYKAIDLKLAKML